MMDKEALHAAVYGVTELDMTEWLNWTELVALLQESVSPVLWKFFNKPTGLQSQIPWGSSVPLLSPQVGKSVVGPRTFLTVWEFPCFICSIVYEPSAGWLYGG